jgi:hypothetical protein
MKAGPPRGGGQEGLIAPGHRRKGANILMFFIYKGAYPHTARATNRLSVALHEGLNREFLVYPNLHFLNVNLNFKLLHIKCCKVVHFFHLNQFILNPILRLVYRKQKIIEPRSDNCSSCLYTPSTYCRPISCNYKIT